MRNTRGGGEKGRHGGGDGGSFTWRMGAALSWMDRMCVMLFLANCSRSLASEEAKTKRQTERKNDGVTVDMCCHMKEIQMIQEGEKKKKTLIHTFKISQVQVRQDLQGQRSVQKFGACILKATYIYIYSEVTQQLSEQQTADSNDTLHT